MTMPESKKLLIVFLMFLVGATGFCVSTSLTFSHYSRDNLTLTLICIDIVLRTFDFIFHLSDESVGRSILVRRLLLHSLVGPPQIHASRSPESHDRNKLL